jgi:hypothetical protein
MYALEHHQHTSRHTDSLTKEATETELHRNNMNRDNGFSHESLSSTSYKRGRSLSPRTNSILPPQQYSRHSLEREKRRRLSHSQPTGALKVIIIFSFSSSNFTPVTKTSGDLKKVGSVHSSHNSTFFLKLHLIPEKVHSHSLFTLTIKQYAPHKGPFLVHFFLLDRQIDRTRCNQPNLSAYFW